MELGHVLARCVQELARHTELAMAREGLVVVTGARRGIGAEVAKRFLNMGFEVLGVVRRPDGAPAGMRTVVADLSTPSGIEAATASIAQICRSEAKRIAILDNNAGVVGDLRELTVESAQELDGQMALHVKAPMTLTLGLLDYFAPGARVLNMSTRAAHIPVDGCGIYCITKHAAAGMTGLLRNQLKERVLVASLIPGEVDTGMQADLRRPEAEQFALSTFFRENEKHLIPVEVAATFICWVLTEASEGEYARDDDWYIYDSAHHSRWLPEGQAFDYPEP